MIETPEFVALVHRLKGLIRAESIAAMGSELKSGGLEGFGMDVGPKGVDTVL
jgi:NitT/TauT family transport system ATP-binding protein